MSIESVTRDLAEIASVLGLKPAVPAEPLNALHSKRQYGELCRAIGQHMGLANPVRLGTASQSAGAPESERFRTTALSKTDATGRGTHGIFAQVNIPAKMPHYGTVAFNSYTVELLLHADFGQVPCDTAIGLLAHELSHVLLHSLRHPQRDSEQFTDLVPLALGFASIVARGRTTTARRANAEGSYTTTTTYGYLTDDEFSCAQQIVGRLLEKHRHEHLSLALLAGRLTRRADAVHTSLADVRNGLAQAASGHRTVRRGHAQRIVALHGSGVLDDRDHRARQISDRVAVGKVFTEGLVHYSPANIARLETVHADCTRAERELVAMEEELAVDRYAIGLPLRSRDRTAAWIAAVRAIWNRLLSRKRDRAHSPNR
jgi:hypothetical protein